MNELDVWLAALRIHGGQPTRSGSGYKARCPAHEDRNPSLSLTVGDTGRVVAFCHSGCSFDEIRDALGVGGAEMAIAPAPPPVAPRTPTPLPTGPNVTIYPYVDAEGADQFAVVRRDTAKGKSISQWRPQGDGWIPSGPGSNRPLYRLPDLTGSDGRVVVVEGEKCVEAVKTAWPGVTVTTWSGGTKAWNRTEFEPLRGRYVTLVADDDQVGHDVMLDIAGKLSGMDCQVMLVLPEFGIGDIADWLADDVQIAADRIKDLLQSYPVGGQIADENFIRTNEFYKILGLDGTSIALRLVKESQVDFYTPRMIQDTQTLGGIAPARFWAGHMDLQIGTLTKSDGQSVGQAIIEEARRMGQYDRFTTTGRGAAIINGGAQSGSVVYHLGDRLLVNGSEESLEYGGKVWLAEPRIVLAPASSPEQMRAIAAAVMRYRWASPDDGRRILGWVVAAICGGALEWRPHIMLSAPASAGKSWLLKYVIEDLMGRSDQGGLLHKIADATPAAIARMTANGSLPIAIDEAEPSNPWVRELLTQLRIASGAEGMRVRADTNNSSGVVAQTPRFCALLSSTATPLLTKANASRLSMVRLGAAIADWPSVRNAIIEAMAHAPGVRTRIINRAATIVAEAKRIAEELQDTGMDTREALATAALTAGWQEWGLDDNQVNAAIQGSGLPDAAEALLTIFALRVRLDHGERSLISVLQEDKNAALIADLYGIKFAAENSGIALAPRHRGLKKELGRTDLEGVDLVRLLEQLPGVVRSENPLHFGELKVRALIFPWETLEAVGVEMGA